MPSIEFQNDENTAGLWHFNNNLNDESGNGYHGAGFGTSFASNTPGLTESISGCTDSEANNYNPDATFDDGSCEYVEPTDYSLSFNSNRVEVPSSESLNSISNTISIYGRINPAGFDGAHRRIINRGDCAGGSRYILVVNPQGKLEFGNGNGNKVISNSQLAMNEWSEIFVHMNEGEAELYINGAFEGSATIGNLSYNSSAPLYIGSECSTSYYEGLIDELAIWNTAVDNNTPDFDNGLIAHYTFNSGEGNTLLDHSGNQNHGTIYGATWVENDCSSELDICGVCGGDNSTCLPESTEMAFYYFTSITLDGETVPTGSEIMAKNEVSGRIVGYGQSENVCDVNTEIVVYGVIGNDLDAVFGTEGYLTGGDTPQFYVNGIKAHYIAANGDELQSIPAFVSLEQYTDLTLNLVADCNGDMGGAASVDYCGDCWGGDSGNEALVNDPDADEICGENDNCPDTANTNQANYDNDEMGDACDSDDDNDGEIDENDSDPLNEFACHDDDGDGCDECADGSLGDNNDDGEDNDADGWCNDGDNWPDCFNEVIDSDPNDECGNCNGDGFAATCIGTDDCEDMDCLGNCGQSAYIDDCGECDDNPNTDCYDLSLDLHAGPNLISFPALPEDTSVPSIFDDNGCIVLGVIGEGIGAVYLMGNWVGSLQFIEQDRGYWVKVYDDCNFTLEDCEPVSYDSDGEVVYEMQFGPNLISYPFQTSQTIENAVGHVEDNIYGFIAEGIAAFNLDGQWYGSMEEFKSGQGYWLLALNDFTFSFNGTEAGLSRDFLASALTELPDQFKVEQSTRQAFYFVEDIVLQTVELDEEDILLSYSDENLIGARYWNGSYTDIPAMGDDNSETTLNFAKQGDQILFKLFDGSTGNLVELESDEPAYWQDFGMTIVSLSEKINLPETFSLAKAYPNPFNPVTTLNYTLPVESKVLVAVYDLSGREVARLIEDSRHPGHHQLTWDAAEYSSGIYLLYLQAGEFQATQKLVLMK